MASARGEKIQASNLGISQPKLLDDGTTILLTVPTETVRKEIRRDETPLLSYLHEKLQNYSTKIEIKVDDTSENFRKYAIVSPQEKYKKLLQKNQNLEQLRQKFDLKFSND